MKYIKDQANSTNMVRLDLSDLPSLLATDGVELFCRFNTETYGKLRDRSDSGGWTMIFDIVNRFFDTLTIEQKRSVAMMILTIHRRVQLEASMWEPDNINQALQQIGELIITCDEEIGLCDLIKAFVRSNVPIGDFSNAGRGARDTPERTFHAHEAEDLLIIVMLCKLLAPIFGATIAAIQRNQRLDNVLKETHTLALLTPIFAKRYGELVAKLNDYIGHIIEVTFNAVFKQSEDAVSMSGTNTSTMIIRQRALVYIKNMVNVDLFHNDDGNIVAYICSIVRRAIGSQRSAISQHGGSTIRLTPDQLAGSDRATTASVLEVNSLVSDQPADVPYIAIAFIDNHIARFLEQHTLDTGIYREMVKWYHIHPYPLSMLAIALVNTAFATDIGGSTIIQMLRLVDVTKLVAAVQLLAFSKSWPNLGHLLTAQKHLLGKQGNTDEETRIKLGYANSFDYRNCREAFVGNNIGIFDLAMRSLMENIVATRWVYNTAEVIWEQSDPADEVVSLNGREIVLNHLLTDEIAAAISLML